MTRLILDERLHAILPIKYCQRPELPDYADLGFFPNIFSNKNKLSQKPCSLSARTFYFLLLATRPNFIEQHVPVGIPGGIEAGNPPL